MARAIWSGSISFGLVNIPIKVQSAVSEKDIHFHMLHKDDGARIKFKKYCPEDDREVDNSEIVKGYEVSRGQYVTFTDEELEAADPEAARTIDIQEFVDLAEIDPSYFDRPYYLVPDKNAEKPYALLRAALGDTKKVGVARVIMRDKEYLVAIRAQNDVLLMETMHFADEVVPPTAIAAEANVPHDVDKKQLALAKTLIDNLSGPFDAGHFENEHRKRVMELIEKKAAGHKIVTEPEAKVQPRTKDILAALEASIVASKGKPKAGGHAVAAHAAKPKARKPHKEHAAA